MTIAPSTPAGCTLVEDFDRGGWKAADLAGRARHYCELLERGAILYLPGVPFELAAADTDFLLSHGRGESRFHKNISYRPTQDVLRGAEGTGEDQRRLHSIMRNYSAAVTVFARSLLAPYAGRWALDYASYRPLEEQGRELPLHRRNDLLHVDAFPSRPTRGARILRVFTNISPAQPRIWVTAERFPELAQRFAVAAGLSSIASPPLWMKAANAALAAMGLATHRSAYDRFMLRFHDWLKENAEWQRDCPKTRSEFPPASTWLVMTDTVPHAALSGRYALEQTFIVPMGAMVAPEAAPIRVLEQIAGCKLA